jgi:mono/diheme cytochrome c family protein
MSRRAPGRARVLAAIGAIAALLAASGLVAAACGGGSDEASRPTTGAGIYRAYCLTCHGADGQGGVGPQLAGRMEDAYPNVDDQVAVVTNGTGRMPSFRGTLSATEIAKVVEYERTDLGS